MISKLLQFPAAVAILSAGMATPAAGGPAAGLPPDASHLTLCYDKPAAPGMNEALPIGGGKFGGLIYGAPNCERVVLNDIAFWTGSEISSDNYDKMGGYQMLGELLFEMPGDTKVEAYQRALDIKTAIHTVSYKLNGVTYGREAFASHPDGVMVFRFAPCTGTLTLRGTHQETTQATGNSLSFAGTLPNGLKYETKLVALHDGGTLQAGDGKLELAGCQSVTLIVATGTDYVLDYARNFRGTDPHADIERRLAAAESKGYAALKAAHIADYQGLYNRVALNIGASPADRLALPTNKRKVLHAAQGGDPELEALMFQYGRYLLIACSRPGGLPANLQGLWNDSNKAMWHSDYHTNINIQMNYWPAEPANLSECHTPLFELVTSQLPAWRKATAADKRFQTADGISPGWAVRTSHGIHGDQGWDWDVSANAWYCQHYWMHYEFGGDKVWLKNVAYPVIKETCEFWAARLKTLPDGKLVVPNGWSPEHGPHEDGVSYNQQIVWDLFKTTSPRARCWAWMRITGRKSPRCATSYTARKSANGASSRNGCKTVMTRTTTTATPRISSRYFPASKSASRSLRSSPKPPKNRSMRAASRRRAM